MSCVGQQLNLRSFFPSFPSFPSSLSSSLSPSSSSSSSCCCWWNSNQTKKRISFSIVNSVAISNAQTQKRLRLKQLFREANERCLNDPMDGVSFTLQDFTQALDHYDFHSQLGTKVIGTVFCTDENGALVEIAAKSAAYLPLQEACIHRVNHVEEAGIVPGFRAEFFIIGENEANDSLILSLRPMQYGLAWERCRQLQADNVVVNGKVVGAKKGGVMVEVEGLRGFVPFSQISTKSTGEELLEKELPLKFEEVDEKQSILILSNRKAVADSQPQLGIGSVVIGSVRSLKPYGAIIDIGGINGLLHVSQISHDRVTDVEAVLQPGDILKVMILSHDQERGRVSLSTKKLEPTHGDMIRNPKLVFEKAEEMAQTFRQRIADVEAKARANMLNSSPRVD